MIGAVAESGRVVFAPAAAMVAVFFTFALSGPLPPKEMGVILGVAVLLDAALVRLLLVPVVLRLLGRWAWWLPEPLGRVLPDVRFGHSWDNSPRRRTAGATPVGQETSGSASRPKAGGLHGWRRLRDHLAQGSPRR